MTKLMLKRLMNATDTVVQNKFRITGSCFNTGSHSVTNCIDIGANGSAYSFYAPVDLKCVYVSTDGYNTAYFESLNTVEFANGETDYVSFTFGHCNTSNMTVTAGNNYSAGSLIYTEGTAGGVARHCHMRVGKGKFKSTRLHQNNSSQYDINTACGPMTISDAFYSDGMTVVYDSETNPELPMRKKYKWRTTSAARKDNEVYIVAKYSRFRIRRAPNTTYGDEAVMVPIGGRARIVTFLPGFQDDGYQWAFVDYNNGQIFGYAQLDFCNYQILQRTRNTPALYLQATSLAFRVRSSINTTTGSELVPVGGKAQIMEFMSDRHTDGYQWARTKYGSINLGYSQMDTNNAYTIDWNDTTDTVN